MRNTVAKLKFIALTFNVIFISKSCGDTKEDVLFKTRPKPKVNVQLRWISLFSKSSWIKATASELSVMLKKKLMKTGILLIKMDIANFTLLNLDVLTV